MSRLVRPAGRVRANSSRTSAACRQILLNLMSNAVKFTPSGRPGDRSSARFRELHDPTFYVADTGIGIAAEDLPGWGIHSFKPNRTTTAVSKGRGWAFPWCADWWSVTAAPSSSRARPAMGTRVTVRLPLDCRAHGNTMAASPAFETSGDDRQDAVARRRRLGGTAVPDTRSKGEKNCLKRLARDAP